MHGLPQHTVRVAWHYLKGGDVIFHARALGLAAPAVRAVEGVTMGLVPRWADCSPFSRGRVPTARFLAAQDGGLGFTAARCAHVSAPVARRAGAAPVLLAHSGHRMFGDVLHAVLATRARFREAPARCPGGARHSC